MPVTASSMKADPAAHPCPQQERLGSDRCHVRVEIGQQQAGKLEPALVDHVAAGRRRPVPVRIVRLPARTASHPPRCRAGNLPGCNLPQRPIGHHTAWQANRHRRLAQPRTVRVLATRC